MKIATDPRFPPSYVFHVLKAKKELTAIRITSTIPKNYKDKKLLMK